MKFPLISTVLGFEIQMYSGLFGNKNHAKLDEDAMNKLENNLKNNNNAKLIEQVEELKKNNANLKEEADKFESVNNALEQALELNGLNADDTVTGIELLGTTCKKYGDSKNRHAILINNGEEKDPSGDALIDGVFDPNDAHNQID